MRISPKVDDSFRAIYQAQGLYENESGGEADLSVSQSGGARCFDRETSQHNKKKRTEMVRLFDLLAVGPSR
jgi:hypothetical protein